MIQNLPNGHYTLKVFRVGHTRNDPYTAYLNLDSPPTLTPTQLATLQPTGAPTETRKLTIKNHTFHQQFPTNQNDVYLVTLTPTR